MTRCGAIFTLLSLVEALHFLLSRNEILSTICKKYLWWGNYEVLEHQGSPKSLNWLHLDKILQLYLYTFTNNQCLQILDHSSTSSVICLCVLNTNRAKSVDHTDNTHANFQRHHFGYLCEPCQAFERFGIGRCCCKTQGKAIVWNTALFRVLVRCMWVFWV